MGQEHHESAETVPLVLGRADELVDDDRIIEVKAARKVAEAPGNSELDAAKARVEVAEKAAAEKAAVHVQARFFLHGTVRPSVR